MFFYDFFMIFLWFIKKSKSLWFFMIFLWFFYDFWIPQIPKVNHKFNHKLKRKQNHKKKRAEKKT